MTQARRRTALLALLLVPIAALRAVGEEPSAAQKPSADKPAAQATAKPRVLVTISKETTYITEPLRPDGYPDYLAALNQRASKGVTAENNAAVLFWRAMGPGSIDAKNRDAYFKMLGIPPLLEEGTYFVTLHKYLKSQRESGNPASAKTEEEYMRIYDQLDLAIQRPWSKKEFPVFAEWLEANEEPLALLTEASKRPRRYDPLLPDKDDIVLTSLSLAVIEYRNVVRALSARAMLRAGEGRVDQGWDDLMTCHRLARLVGQGPMLIDALVAIAIDCVASERDQGILSCVNLKSPQVAKMRRDLGQLPPMPKMVDKLDVSERFMYLDAVSCVARRGISSLPTILGGGTNGVAQNSLIDAIGSVVDWNVPLRMGNSWYDRFVDAFSSPPRTERKAALDKIDEDLRKLSKECGDWKSLAVSILSEGRQAISERIGRLFASLFLPAISICVNAEDRATMQFELAKLAFALAAYHADSGSYPGKLAELTPKYIAEVPKDIFSDSDLHYQREGDGYLLYSVGVNGRDDGGKRIEDRSTDENSSEDWDDLAIRIPAR
jgi:hypothetical protein